MRRYRLITLCLLLAVVLSGFLYFLRIGRPPTTDSPQVRWKRPEARVVLNIEGMDCVMCAAGLQNTLRAVPGVRRADVSFQDKQAVVEYDPAVVDAARFEKLVADSGFKVASPVPARP